jgi:hypothetical protein
MGTSGRLQPHAKRISDPHRLRGSAVNSHSGLGKEESPKAPAEIRLHAIQPTHKYSTEEPNIDHDDHYTTKRRHRAGGEVITSWANSVRFLSGTLIT